MLDRNLRIESLDEQIKVIHKSIFEIRFPDGTSKTLSEEQANQLYDSLGASAGQPPEQSQAPEVSEEKPEVSEEKPETVINAAHKRRRAITRLLPEVPF